MKNREPGKNEPSNINRREFLKGAGVVFGMAAASDALDVAKAASIGGEPKSKEYAMSVEDDGALNKSKEELRVLLQKCCSSDNKIITLGVGDDLPEESKLVLNRSIPDNRIAWIIATKYCDGKPAVEFFLISSQTGSILSRKTVLTNPREENPVVDNEKYQYEESGDGGSALVVDKYNKNIQQANNEDNTVDNYLSYYQYIINKIEENTPVEKVTNINYPTGKESRSNQPPEKTKKLYNDIKGLFTEYNANKFIHIGLELLFKFGNYEFNFSESTFDSKTQNVIINGKIEIKNSPFSGMFLFLKVNNKGELVEANIFSQDISNRKNQLLRNDCKYTNHYQEEELKSIGAEITQKGYKKEAIPSGDQLTGIFNPFIMHELVDSVISHIENSLKYRKDIIKVEKK